MYCNDSSIVSSIVNDVIGDKHKKHKKHVSK